MTIDTKECIENICNWMQKNHDSFSPTVGYVGNYYTSGKKPKHWKRRGIIKDGDITIRVFERQSGDERITPSMIIVDLPDEFIVTYSKKDLFIKLEPMSLDNITALGIKVATSFGGYLNCDDNGNLYQIDEVSKKNKSKI